MASCIVKIALKVPELVYVLLADVVDALIPLPKSQAYELITELVVALGVLVLLKVAAPLDTQTLVAETVKLAVGAGVLFTVIDKVELPTDVPHALLAVTDKVPDPAVLSAVILITFEVEVVVALILPVTTQVYEVAPVTAGMLYT